ADGAGHPLAGRAWLPRSRTFVAPDALVAMAKGADAVLLGETHDNPDHHALQAWMVRQLDSPRVAFEMIDGGQEDKLRRHLAARPGDAAGIGPALDWDKSGWPDWTLYRPIAEAALAAGATIAPANLSRADTRALGRGEAPELAARLELDRPLPPEVEDALAREIKDSHCGMLPDKAVPAMMTVQRARDRVMAQALVDGLAEGRPAILIAGSGHVRTDRAVPVHVAALRPGTRSFAIGFVEVQDDATDPAAYAEAYDADSLPFDAVVFTPRAQRADQCEELRKHMERKGKAG
ncbi:MAG: ChaN family lipoprotein, partial [Pseudomonadota bacterium]